MKRLLSWFERKKIEDEGGNFDQPRVLVSNFTPLNQLEQLLIDAGYDPEVRPAFELCFLDHELLFAIRDDGYEEGPLAANSQELSIYTLEADDGKVYPAVFSALERGYECFGPETVMARLGGRDLLKTFPDSGVWLNPSSAFGVLWSADDVKRILGR